MGVHNQQLRNAGNVIAVLNDAVGNLYVFATISQLGGKGMF